MREPQTAKIEGVTLVCKSETPKGIDFTKPLQLVQSILAIVGVLVGAWWVYQQGYLDLHAVVTQTVQVTPLDEQSQLVRVKVTTKNEGYLPLSLPETRVTIHSIRESDRNSNAFDNDGNWFFPFPIKQTKIVPARGGEISPDTSESLWLEFLVDRDLSVVLVRSSVCAELLDCFSIQQRNPMIWTDSVVVDLNSPLEEEER